jgi:Mechanosensitive ion channel, conserved TM helix
VTEKEATMNEQLHTLFMKIMNTFFAFAPSFLVGIILIIIGWILSWFVKRMIIQMLILLKFDRALVRFPWGRAFSKADVRYGFYSFIGNICFIIIFLLFLHYALLSWGLGFISELLREGILFFPKFIAAGAILGIGWMIASWASQSLYKFLYQEQIPQAVLISYYAKIALIILFSTIAFAELDIAREIIIIGFTVTFITLGVIAIILIVINGRRPHDPQKTRPDVSETKDPDARDEQIHQ